MKQKRLGLVVLAALVAGGTALAPFSQATPDQSTPPQSAGVPATAHAAPPVISQPRVTSASPVRSPG